MKICLLGGAPSSCLLAPWGDDSWEIWACSPGNWNAPRVDAWFEMHSLDRKDVQGNEAYISTLKRHPRVYVSKLDERLPHAILYPREEILPEFGGMFVQSFMQSTVSYMAAMAVSQLNKGDFLGMWGVDMAAESEYDYQRPGVHFFFNEAQKREIQIIAPPQSDILEPLPPYGYKEHYPMYWRQKARKIELNNRLREAEAKEAEARNTVLALRGAIGDINYTNNTYLKP